MIVNFKDICGNSYNLEITNGLKVADVCKSLSRKIGNKENQIFLVSTNDKFNYYQDNEKMKDILDENPDYIMFIQQVPKDIYSDQNSNSSLQDKIGKNEYKIEHPLKSPSKTFFNSLSSARNWYYNDIYDDYSYVVNEVPHDIQDRISQLAELGYHVEDIKEALRTTNYNVHLAIHFLMLHHAHNLDDLSSDDEYIYDSDNDSDNSDVDYFDYPTNTDEPSNQKADEQQRTNKSTHNDQTSEENVANDQVSKEKVDERQMQIEKVSKDQISKEKVDDKQSPKAKANDKIDLNEKADDKKNLSTKEEKINHSEDVFSYKNS